MECAGQRCACSDGSFKEEEEEKICGVRGRMHAIGQLSPHLQGGARLVRRRETVAEAPCGTADGLQTRLLALHEMVRGRAPCEVIRRLREEGDYAVPATLVVYGSSLFAALAMDPVRPPFGNSMAGYLRWLTDQVHTKQIVIRDVGADPMTKGSTGSGR
eukprot:4798723-Pyramimonas_sp.AAC.1